MQYFDSGRVSLGGDTGIHLIIDDLVQDDVDSDNDNDDEDKVDSSDNQDHISILNHWVIELKIISDC